MVLGGGRARYAQPLTAGGTRNVIDYAVQDKGYKYVATEAELNGVTALAPGERLLGLFHDSNMTTEYQPLIASDTGAGSATTKCQPSNRGNEPTLAEMTAKAISLLQGNHKGFVLQVEGASIDKRDHASDACGQIGELIGMDDAIGIAQAFQRTHPDTLIVVSADHSHTSQIIGPTTVPRGQYTTLQTVDGAPIRIAYGTGPIAGSQSHTGATVPVFASGPRAADVDGHDRPDRAVPGPHQHADRQRSRHLDAGRRRHRRRRPRDAGPDRRRSRRVPGLHAGRGPRLHRGADGQRHLHRRRRDPLGRRRRARTSPAVS